MHTRYNPLFDPKTDNLPIDPNVQTNIINTPKDDPQGISQQDQTFLQHVISLVASGTINLYAPSSLLNEAVYSQLSEEIQGKVDQEAFNILSSIRQMYGLYQIGSTQSFQVNNLIRQIRMQKERVEGVRGDVFII